MKGRGEVKTTDLHEYANRYPKAVKSDNPVAYSEALGARADGMLVVDAMLKDDTLPKALVNFIKQRNFDKEKKQTALGKWPSTYCYIEKLSKDWAADWIVKYDLSRPLHKGGIHITVLVLNAVDQNDKFAVKRIFHHLTATEGKDSLPREMLDKVVCQRAFNERAMWVETAIDPRIHAVRNCRHRNGPG